MRIEKDKPSLQEGLGRRLRKEEKFRRSTTRSALHQTPMTSFMPPGRWEKGEKGVHLPPPVGKEEGKVQKVIWRRSAKNLVN